MDYEKIKMVIEKLGFTFSDDQYVYSSASGYDDMWVVRRGVEKLEGCAVLRFAIDRLKHCGTLFSDFYCVVCEEEEPYFEFFSLIEDLERKVHALKTRQPDNEKMYFIKADEMTQIPFENLDVFLDERRAAE